MKITVTKDAGYCFGVRDAVNMAYSASEKYGDVYMLGSIVHNEKVVNDLHSSGAKIVSSLDDVPRESPILFRAHGTVNHLWDDAKKIYDGNRLISRMVSSYTISPRTRGTDKVAYLMDL